MAIGLTTASYETAAMHLAKAGSLTCIVTAGAEGALAVTADGTALRASAPYLTPVDTTGAGDTFVGAFAAMLSEGVSIQKTLMVACEAAALKCLTAGAQAGIPKRCVLKSQLTGGC